MSRRKRNSKITVYKPDGTVQVVKPGKFQKPKSRRATLAAARKSDHWRALKAQARTQGGDRCAYCKGRDRLELHHLTYVRLGKERLEDVILLCQACHAWQHKWLARQG